MPSLPLDQNSNLNTPGSNDTPAPDNGGESQSSIGNQSSPYTDVMNIASAPVQASAHPGSRGQEIVSVLANSELTVDQQLEHLGTIRHHPNMLTEDRLAILFRITHLLDLALIASGQRLAQQRDSAQAATTPAATTPATTTPATTTPTTTAPTTTAPANTAPATTTPANNASENAARATTTPTTPPQNTSPVGTSPPSTPTSGHNAAPLFNRDQILQRLQLLCDPTACSTCDQARQFYMACLADMPTPPVLYDVTYDKLVRHLPIFNSERSLNSSRSSNSNRRNPSPGPHPSQFQYEEFDGRRGYTFPLLGDRALVGTRQARALAGLDTYDLDIAITQRILNFPERWGSLGIFMQDATAGSTTDWTEEYLER
ncbi:uncharacterized protein K460DRAFT_354680 [Cucurbitaria berberidis CBS 394.84]|uniref:Uncharacterized protein n=1 Tax=Cucurbitaria berberidis CBS 394.84 TaxID=1168544 RepID=A0A9P4GG19_9PLEO|nr:uncharacterized protein K460DRAFT_354680 [Cucurbitaria berberidis CBS 394.84]KAF1844801.1 hypothetical protein K460DRAFT_354680 [Cucurbitaria berberidis CBS 394.84]